MSFTSDVVQDTADAAGGSAATSIELGSEEEDAVKAIVGKRPRPGGGAGCEYLVRVGLRGPRPCAPPRPAVLKRSKQH